MGFIFFSIILFGLAVVSFIFVYSLIIGLISVLLSSLFKNSSLMTWVIAAILLALSIPFIILLFHDFVIFMMN